MTLSITLSPFHLVTPSSHQKGETNMKPTGFGVIGAGLFGENHALAYSRLPDVELVAISDIDEERARLIADKYGAGEHYTNYLDLINHPDIVAVSIATPDFAHRDIALAAAKAGKHILCEKPLALTIEDSQAIVNTAKANGVKLMVDFHNRVNPPFVAVKEGIQAGEIGEPAYAYVRLSNTTFVPMEMLSWAGRSSALWFLASHTVDLMRFLLDDEVSRVYAVQREGILSKKGVNTPDFHVAIAEFSKGTVVTFENAWILPRSQPTVFDFKLELLGSEGAMYANPSHHGALEKHVDATMAYSDVLGVTPTGQGRVGGFVLESIARFVDAVLEDKPVLATGEDGVAVTRVLLAMEQSALSGLPIDL
jgi:predicted dehydrogenase